MTYVPENGPARAYPIRYLMWHEIVNDVVDGASRWSKVPMRIFFAKPHRPARVRLTDF